MLVIPSRLSGLGQAVQPRFLYLVDVKTGRVIRRIHIDPRNPQRDLERIKLQPGQIITEVEPPRIQPVRPGNVHPERPDPRTTVLPYTSPGAVLPPVPDVVPLPGAPAPVLPIPAPVQEPVQQPVIQPYNGPAPVPIVPAAGASVTPAQSALLISNYERQGFTRFGTDVSPTNEVEAYAKSQGYDAVSIPTGQIANPGTSYQSEVKVVLVRKLPGTPGVAPTPPAGQVPSPDVVAPALPGVVNQFTTDTPAGSAASSTPPPVFVPVTNNRGAHFLIGLGLAGVIAGLVYYKYKK